jgi:alanine dehydrogenase
MQDMEHHAGSGKKISLGILRETKDPPDKRVPLTPSHCRELKERYPALEILVQPSGNRCFSDEEYLKAGMRIKEELDDCQVLMGVKEVEPGTLMDEKTYYFFSHTAKMQPYNRGLLQSVIQHGITLVDYEYLTRENRERVVAFGRWAGIVGAYNGLRAYGLRSGNYTLKPASGCRDLQELLRETGKVVLNGCRILVTGGGRVAGGALEILQAVRVQEVTPESYLTGKNQGAIFTRLDPGHYTRRSGGMPFEFEHFVAHPDEYENNIHPYALCTDMLVACHFWDPRSPVMLNRQFLADASNPIRVIADISCDINGPIASTIRASTIADPFYGYEADSGSETGPFESGSITVMAVDNLPGELPRDASADFGSALVQHVIPEMLGMRQSGMIERATIAANGTLTQAFGYLKNYLRGKE